MVLFVEFCFTDTSVKESTRVFSDLCHLCIVGYLNLEEI